MDLSKGITINLTLVLAVIAIMSVIGFVGAYGTSNPAVFGHTPGEFAGGTFQSGTFSFPSDVVVEGTIISPYTGSVFTHWGSRNAPPGTQLLYSGTGFTTRYILTGGGTTALCLYPGDAGEAVTSGSAHDNIHPMTTDNDIDRMPNGISPDKIVQCSVVYSDRVHFIKWGRQTCPTGWSVSYSGYSMGPITLDNDPDHNYNANRERICVDSNDFDSSYDKSRAEIELTGTIFRRTNFGDTPGYIVDDFVECAVCLKN